MTNASARPHGTSVLAGAEPQLVVADLAVSIEFYTTQLGFSVAFRYGDPPFYAQVVRDAARLNLRHLDTPVADTALRDVATFRRALRAGVKIAMGSDAVFTGFGENTHELDRFVENGMTPAQAIATATTTAAALLGKEKELGAVAPGYYADIIAAEGDPLTDISAVTHRVRWVMKGGRVV